MKPHAYLILLLVLMDSSQASYTQLYTHPTLQQKRGAWCIVCESEFNSKSASKACCFNDEKHVDVRAFQDFCSKNGFPETRGSASEGLPTVHTTRRHSSTGECDVGLPLPVVHVSQMLIDIRWIRAGRHSIQKKPRHQSTQHIPCVHCVSHTSQRCARGLHARAPGKCSHHTLLRHAPHVRGIGSRNLIYRDARDRRASTSCRHRLNSSAAISVVVKSPVLRLVALFTTIGPVYIKSALMHHMRPTLAASSHATLSYRQYNHSFAPCFLVITLPFWDMIP